MYLLQEKEAKFEEVLSSFYILLVILSIHKFSSHGVQWLCSYLKFSLFIYVTKCDFHHILIWILITSL